MMREEDVMKASTSIKVVLLLFLASMAALPISTGLAQDSESSITVELQEFENSGISGTAVMTGDGGDGVHVSMELVGQELDGNHPTHIHTGTCSNFDPSPIYPLETVNLNPVNREGVSESDVADTTLEELQNGEFVILVHQSPEELTKYLICGEIAGSASASAVTTSATTGVGGTQNMPGTGTGTGLSSPSDWSSTASLVALGTLALLAAVSAEVLRKRQR
jgi:hypothetical protein